MSKSFSNSSRYVVLRHSAYSRLLGPVHLGVLFVPLTHSGESNRVNADSASSPTAAASDSVPIPAAIRSLLHTPAASEHSTPPAYRLGVSICAVCEALVD